MRIDDLVSRYVNLRLTYFRHRKPTPWERREQEAKVNAFLDDLEAYLLKRDWAIEHCNGGSRVYRYGKNSSISLKIKNSIDYFGVHTVSLLDIYLVQKRPILWDRVLADGELVFDYLRKMK